MGPLGYAGSAQFSLEHLVVNFQKADDTITRTYRQINLEVSTETLKGLDTLLKFIA